MAENIGEPDVPEWVREMRELGYTVRVGTDTRGLPYRPEISYHDWGPASPERRRELRRRKLKLVRRRAELMEAFRRRIIPR
jgi:hypothetical protein